MNRVFRMFLFKTSTYYFLILRTRKPTVDLSDWLEQKMQAAQTNLRASSSEKADVGLFYHDGDVVWRPFV